MSALSTKAEKLIERLGQYPGDLVVAFSGGVDSSVVAAAAFRRSEQPGKKSVAVTAHSPSVADWQLQIAKTTAAEIGISHRVIQTKELELEAYSRNDHRRCFFCKQTLYGAIQSIKDFACNESTIVSGTNADDLGDYRPGIEAGSLAGVETPLADLGYGKQDVRELARLFGLSNHQLPASPCLASRIAHGVEVTGERLRCVEVAEDWLRDSGFSDCRVRLHADDLARVEIPSGELDRALAPDFRFSMSKRFTEIGFRFVTIDLQGLRSGSLNPQVVSIRRKTESASLE